MKSYKPDTTKPAVQMGGRFHLVCEASRGILPVRTKQENYCAHAAGMVQ